MAIVLVWSLPAGRAAAADVRSDQVILFMGRDLTGPSKTWSLKPDQPFLAIPYTGDAFRPVSASIKLGADVGVVLFDHPFFSTVDESCDYQLGSDADPQLWWLAKTVMVVPGPQQSGPVEANLHPQEIASLILYRRALGPPPGALLLERRRYVNWQCPAPTKARGYKRLFVPVAAPPHREGCFNLKAALSYGSAGTAAIDFSAASELLLLLPSDLSADYAGIDHHFTVGLYSDKDCRGKPTSVAQPGSATRRFDLKEFGLDRKARSVLIRYDEGPYDAMLLAAGEGAGQGSGKTNAASLGPAPVGSASKETRATTPEEQPAPESGPPAAEPVASAMPEPAEPALRGENESASMAAEGGTQLAAGGEASAGTATAADGASGAAPQTAARSEPAGAAWPAPSNEPGDSASMSGLAPAGEAAATAAPAQADEAATATAPAPSSGGSDAPGAEAPSGGTTGFLVLPDSKPKAAGSAETFKFPLLQGYRLSYCLYHREKCGEPAASEWCKDRGFAGGAASFKIDENIGSLFPTLALGDLQLCANFVCDGFKAITCVP